jgi:exonuclease SbcC
MAGRLQSLSAENFRSIRGPISVSLDAPVVLIHGPNGTGKTSMLSAIELALTGGVPSLARSAADYLAHLPHKLSPDGKASVAIVAEGIVDAGPGKVVADGVGLTPGALLNKDMARFYTERCYLGQSTLARLLEIYEYQDTRNTDSPLTRFVKELLGLQVLDELIEGLHATGDVRRFREPSPLFWSARSDVPELQRAVDTAEADEEILGIRHDQAAAAVAEACLALGLAPDSDSKQLLAALAQIASVAEQSLLELARVRRDLGGAQQQLAGTVTSDADARRNSLTKTNAAARDALTAWLTEAGANIEALVATIRASLPDVPVVAPDPAAAVSRALLGVQANRKRIEELVRQDDVNIKQLADLQLQARQAQARLDQIDAELADAAGANRDLAEAISAIASHIDDEHCPVCGRDFSEVSSTPLSAHVSQEIARLVSAAGRVEALVRDRGQTAGALTDTSRREEALKLTILVADRRSQLASDLAQAVEWENSLTAIAETASAGSKLYRDALSASEALSTLNSRQASVSGLRGELLSYAQTLSITPPADDVPLKQFISDLNEEIDRQTAAFTERKSRAEKAVQDVQAVRSLAAQLLAATHTRVAAEQRQAEMAVRRDLSDRRITQAKELAAKAQSLRNKEVRRVFNDELNAVWRELFIRLAPDEQFVPAFALPSTAGSPVEAVLETLYRSGGKGGNPRAMLSAGNLNTAALTLFLALHLSVPPVLPWLVIDDPVQSMDDVHIAQFAALLRTLKQHGRQVIIAVHDRTLFDYLSLELSPAFNGDRLITIELGRNADGFTTAPWKLAAFEPDRAIAA